MRDSKVLITLELQETASLAVVKAKRGDTGRKLQVMLADGGAPYSISQDCYAVFTGKKPDGTVLYNRCAVADNVIEYVFSEQTCSAPGRIPAEIRLYGNDEKLLTSAYFVLEVHDTVFHEDDVISQDEMNALDALVMETTALKTEIEEKLESGAFVGPQGPQGPRGQDGTVAFEELTNAQRESLRGEPGLDGQDGKDGKDGKDGADGAPGATGATGPAGPSGPAGSNGAPGKSAYAYAQDGGYSGSEAEFAQKLAKEYALLKDFQDHTGNKNNPHKVTAAQAGALADTVPHVLEQGTSTGGSGIWSYRTWSDGLAECWGFASETTGTGDTSGTSKFAGGDVWYQFYKETFPFTNGFDGLPAAFIGPMEKDTGTAMGAIESLTSTTIRVELIGAEKTVKSGCYIHAIGKLAK